MFLSSPSDMFIDLGKEKRERGKEKRERENEREGTQ